MFYRILISLVLCVGSLNAMDQEQSFPFQDLPKDTKQLILFNAYKNHGTPEEALHTFKHLVLVCKDSAVVPKNSIYTKALMKDLVKKYEAKAIAIPLALHSTRALRAFKRAYKKSLVTLTDEIIALGNTLTPEDKEEDQYTNWEFKNACKINDVNAVKYALASGIIDQWLILSPQCARHPETLKLLIAGANVNSQGYDVQTSLRRIVQLPNALPLVQILIAAGADATLRNKEGNTPLTCLLAGRELNSADVDQVITLLSLAGSEIGPLWALRFWLSYKFTKCAQQSACTIV